MEQPTKESFLNDVKNHTCTCFLNNELYRHYRFKNPETSNMFFDIVTWPGYLSFSGDMGCFVFARIEDMFAFFRHDDINIGYWAEKLEAVDKSEDFRAWSDENFRKSIKGWWEAHYEDNLESEEAKEVWSQLEDEILSNADCEWEAVHAINNFKCQADMHFDFSDFWASDHTAYTYRYVWCCYAIIWAIKEIDKIKL